MADFTKDTSTGTNTKTSTGSNTKSSTSSTTSGSWWDTALDWGSKLFGGGDSSSDSNVYGSILSGLGGAADALISKESVEEKGKQDRKTLDFQASLLDYYKQKDKVRKRAALDTYGQFSTMDRWAPGAQATPSLDQPSRPGY